jgi:2-polyprenyl-3-methyl-5-hydroxy-6-metoxy-1,4-benzoquinol methylase
MNETMPSGFQENAQTLARERDFFNEFWGRSARRLQPDDCWTFRDSITPAYLPGGSPRGLTHLVAYEILMRHGVAGTDVLDYACGLGKWSVHLAQLGARVTGFDLSDSAIAYARRRAEVNHLGVRFDVADASQLPYRDERFDVVVGIGALHHVVKYPGTGEELHRVMRPNGVAVFAENLGHNPIIEIVRNMTMPRGAGDVILTLPMIRAWGHVFRLVEIRPNALLFMLKRITRNKRLLHALHRIDTTVLESFPQLRRYCGECVITFRK